MNLATIKERGPCLEKIVPVRLTHESGSSEMRQSQPSTFAEPADDVPGHVGDERGDTGQEQEQRETQLTGARQRAGREEERDRRKREADLLGQDGAEDYEIAVAREHADRAVHVSVFLRLQATGRPPLAHHCSVVDTVHSVRGGRSSTRRRAGCSSMSI
jgi:hypothetical protein